MMMVPEAWGEGTEMSDEQRAFDEIQCYFHGPLGWPSCLVFTDGIQVGAFLDRNGLRPSRYTLMKIINWLLLRIRGGRCRPR
ncbi:hypothetical protein N1E17_01840 [Lacticaseibacillus paracasei]